MRDTVLFGAIWCSLIALTHIMQIILIAGSIPFEVQQSMTFGWMVFSYMFALPTTMLIRKSRA